MPIHAPGRPQGSPSRPTPSRVVQARTAERPSGQHLAPAGRGKPLPGEVREKMERALGHDFSRVRIHEGGTPESLGAIAYTRGTDVHFAPGRYSPATRSGQELLGHELTHVIQQQAGRVAVPQGAGAPINADPALEAEAELRGKAAASAASTASRTSATAPGPAGAIQCGKSKGQSLARRKQRRIKDEKKVRSDPHHIPSGEIGYADPPGDFNTWREYYETLQSVDSKKKNRY